MKYLIPLLLLCFLVSCTKSCNEAKPIDVSKKDTLPKITMIDEELVLPESEHPLSSKRKPPLNVSQECVVLLKFEGGTINSQYWNGGVPFTVAPSGLTELQKGEIHGFLVDTYTSHWKVLITEDQAMYDRANPYNRIMLYITPTSAWRPGVSGITYIDSRTWGDNTPCFVFPDRLYNITAFVKRIAVHELGHAFNLYHQDIRDSTCTRLISSYKPGLFMGDPLQIEVNPQWGINPCSPFYDDTLRLTTSLGHR